MKQHAFSLIRKILTVMAVSLTLAGSAASISAAEEYTMQKASDSSESSGEETSLKSPDSSVTADSPAEDIIATMPLEEKIAQMIIPAFRTWNGTNVTDLSQVPELAAALRKHQYGGVILYAANVSETGQTARLLSDLQENNAQSAAAVQIPYFTAADQEGGIVVRLMSGTRMTGSMAIAATGDHAAENAFRTGQVIGEELAALGFNVDFAPDIDVNNNAANPVIGTRAFSDDPEIVSFLGSQFNKGLAGSNVIATYKHFPGHGDTSTDSHIGTPSVAKTIEQLNQTEFIPFVSAIGNGADMIMTAHITYPLIDDEVTFADGSKGWYPATMSGKMITEILRGDLGYNGLVITDALEMDAIEKAALVPGEAKSTEYRANIAEKVINAGVDLLLLPLDMKDAEAVSFYDDYIAALADKVRSGLISEDRINESLTRIINVKKKYGILGSGSGNTGASTEEALNIVGSAEHHAIEAEIAEQAVTLTKNADLTLPLSGHEKHIVFAGRNNTDHMTILYTVRLLQQNGLIDGNARIEDLVDGSVSGDESSPTKITIDYYYETSPASVHYTDALKAAVKEADVVIGLSKVFNLAALQDTNAQYQGINTLMQDTHAAGGRFVLLSDNLPYDSARYQDADAIVLAYMGSGLDMDPTARAERTDNMKAVNANVVAAIKAMFDDGGTPGRLPVNIPSIIKQDDGTVVYSPDILYERGFGLDLQYAFTEGMGQTYAAGPGEQSLNFKNNARADKLVKVLVDGAAVPEDQFTADTGSTRLTLLSGFLKTLAPGEHKLTAEYDYGRSAFAIDTTFYISAAGSGTENAQNGNTTPAPVTSPPTGDPQQNMLWLLLAGAAMITAVCISRRQARN